MKTIVRMKMFVILAALAGLTISTLDAAETRSWNVIPGNDVLAPATPRVAVFGDNAPETLVDISTLAPSTPQVATFEEPVAEADNTAPQWIAPVVPSEADFNDQI